MKNTKIVFIGLVMILGIWWLGYELLWEGKRNLGYLSDPCNKEYKIEIEHYSSFDHTQPLYFKIIKKNKVLYTSEQFDITNNTGESLSSFEIHCYDKVLYLTWKNDNIPIIMFDTKTKYLYPHSYENDHYVFDKYKALLFNKIKKGNKNLKIE